MMRQRRGAFVGRKGSSQRRLGAGEENEENSVASQKE